MLFARSKPSVRLKRIPRYRPDDALTAAPASPSAVDAIFADTDVPEGEEAWIDRNAEESIDAEIAEGDSPSCRLKRPQTKNQPS